VHGKRLVNIHGATLKEGHKGTSTTAGKHRKHEKMVKREVVHEQKGYSQTAIRSNKCCQLKISEYNHSLHSEEAPSPRGQPINQPASNTHNHWQTACGTSSKSTN